MNSADWLDPRKVAIAAAGHSIDYPRTKPFWPSSQFPEFSGRLPLANELNPVYGLCRQLFVELKLDPKNSLTQSWNPLSGLISPGNKVLIKPNLVRHIHLTGGDYQTVVTHGSLIRCMLDYVALALRGQGEIVVGDAPVQSADFQKIVEHNGLQQVCEDVSRLWGIPVKLVDFRLWAVELDDNHCVVDSKTLAGDSSGYRPVDLGQRSLLEPLAEHHDRFRVTSYDCSEMVRHHNQTVNEYLIPKTVLEADVVISLPKLKTHRKVCLTAALKNLVGINGHKDWLPHHRCGAVEDGGDEYLHKSKLKEIRAGIESRAAAATDWSRSLGRLGARITRRMTLISGTDPFEEGSWYGNDTLWRTVLDLNRLLLYADREGKMMEIPQRRCFTVVDGIVAGEGEGPMEPDVRRCGVLVAGTNPVAIDAVLATMIGFDYRKIPIIAHGFSIDGWSLTDFAPSQIDVCSSDTQWQGLKVGEPCQVLCFVPPSGWRGHVEFQVE